MLQFAYEWSFAEGGTHWCLDLSPGFDVGFWLYIGTFFLPIFYIWNDRITLFLSKAFAPLILAGIFMICYLHRIIS